MTKILIVEDDKNIREELVYLLKQNGYETDAILKFEDLTKQIIHSNPKLVLLDINIPLINGKYILKELRKESNIPIIMVTSSNQDVDEIISISYGADDYITKPYNPEILLLRIEAVLRRSNQLSEIIEYQNIKINVSKSVIQTAKEEIILSKNELSIFLYLYKNKGKIVSRNELISYLWNSDEFIDDNTLTVNINRLRNKLKDIGLKDVIETRRGQGYILL